MKLSQSNHFTFSDNTILRVEPLEDDDYRINRNGVIKSKK